MSHNNHWEEDEKDFKTTRFRQDFELKRDFISHFKSLLQNADDNFDFFFSIMHRTELSLDCF
jgi:hypothetical protein